MPVPVREPDPEFESFLVYLSSSRNFDFTAYKRGSLQRRIQKRMQSINVTSYTDYQDYLEVHPDEFTELFNTILINVTSFFRDPPAWEFIAKDVIPHILEEKKANEPIRVWSAGCASGEEAYTLAMLLAEALGVESFRQRVKIYATDVDEEALATGRQATYPARLLKSVPGELRDRYFDHVNGSCSFKKELRRAVIFGRHDLLHDAPISRVDLLVCRNTLMYLNSESQGRVLARLFFALNNKGYLFLGKAETLLTHTATLTPVDLKYRIFSKTVRQPLRDRIQPLPASGDGVAVPAGSQLQLQQIAFEVDPVAQVTVDANGVCCAINERAREMFGIHVADVGRPLQVLEFSYRPIELRSLIDQATRENRVVLLREVEWTTPAFHRWLDVNVIPLTDHEFVIGAKLMFVDVTRFKELQQQLQHSKNELETAYEELQSTNEELETTNEELQSTIEELETTNEELQSTNEELETMNEELQSTNEELETVNTEMRDRGNQLNDVNSFLESILTSLKAGVVVVDGELRVQAWNRRAEDLWGLRGEEVEGKHFLNLDIGLPVDELKGPIRKVLDGTETSLELSVPAVNRRGRPIQCKVLASGLFDVSGALKGAILLMEDSLDGASPS